MPQSKMCSSVYEVSSISHALSPVGHRLNQRCAPQFYRASTLLTRNPLWVSASVKVLRKFYKASSISQASPLVGHRLNRGCAPQLTKFQPSRNGPLWVSALIEALRKTLKFQNSPSVVPNGSAPWSKRCNKLQKASSHPPSVVPCGSEPWPKMSLVLQLYKL